MGTEEGMRYQGEIVEWSDERGFGYIRPRGSGVRDAVVYLHVSAVQNRKRKPVLGDTVTYETEQSRPEPGKRLRTDVKAVRVAYLGEDVVDAPKNEHLFIAFGLCFLLAVAVISLIANLSPLLIAWLIIASLVTYLVYWWDKQQAQDNAWRVSESSLHWLSILGGWPGAAIAQTAHRHKTQKKSFRLVYGVTITLNILCTIIACVLLKRG